MSYEQIQYPKKFHASQEKYFRCRHLARWLKTLFVGPTPHQTSWVRVLALLPGLASRTGACWEAADEGAHVEDLDRVLGFWLQPDPALTSVGIYEVHWPKDIQSLFFSLFQIKQK